MQEMLDQIRRLGMSDEPLLITDDTGTAAGLLAQAVHDNSPRRCAPFIAVKCSAIAESEGGSELFGYETGASGHRRGLIEIANGGTLFLQEIREMPVDLQRDLLRLLQDGEVSRPGGREPIK